MFGNSLIYDLSLWVLFFIFIAYLYFSRNHNYWTKRGVPHVKPVPFFGNFLDIFLVRKSIGVKIWELYQQTRNHPFVGIYNCDEPCLLVNDPVLIKNILVKDFNNFMNRAALSDSSHDPIGSNILFMMKGDDWRWMRKKITSIFSTGKLKAMYGQVIDVAGDMVQYLERHVGLEKTVDVRELTGKFTTDSITSSAFGLAGDSFKDEQAPLRVASRRIFNWTNLKRGFSMTSSFVAPKLAKLLRLEFVDAESATFLHNVFMDTMNQRKTNGLVRNDMLDILLKLFNDQTNQENKLEDYKLVAQGIQFFIAGYETTNAILQFTLHELATNLNVQKKLKDEIEEIRNEHEVITYDLIHSMDYLDCCIQEGMRKHPALPFLDRRCTKDYQIPGTDVIIEKGTAIYFSIIGLQRDSKYFPDPERFYPERFNAKIKNTEGVTYMPFGIGPRYCLGERYGKMGLKIALFHILSNYEIHISKDTPKNISYDPNAFLIAPRDNMLPLLFQKITRS